jgi:putative transposase
MQLPTIFQGEGRKSDQLKRLKELEVENPRLRQVISNLRRDKLFLKEAVRASPSLYREH